MEHIDHDTYLHKVAYTCNTDIGIPKKENELRERLLNAVSCNVNSHNDARKTKLKKLSTVFIYIYYHSAFIITLLSKHFTSQKVQQLAVMSITLQQSRTVSLAWFCHCRHVVMWGGYKRWTFLDSMDFLAFDGLYCL